MKVMSYSEVLLRLNPHVYERLEQASALEFSFTGTGLNFLAGLSLHGIETELISALPDNRLGDVCEGRIKMHGVGTNNLHRMGNHLGSYIIELGYGVRPSQVTYLDRAHSSFNTHILSEEVIESVISDMDVLHICGIALSTSSVSMNNACKLVAKAHKLNKKIIFDFNFRPSLNTSMSMDTLKEAYEYILKHSHTVFGSMRDVSRFMDCEKDEDIHQFMKHYGIEVFAGSVKSSLDGENFLQGKLYTNNNTYTSALLLIQTLDRIGTGDAFASALVASLLKGKEAQWSVEYASVASQLAFTTMGDVPILSEKFILEHMSEPKDVIR